MLFGLVLLYGLNGSTLIADIGDHLTAERQPALALAFVLVFLGLGFKAGYVPARFWIPDYPRRGPIMLDPESGNVRAMVARTFLASLW